MEKDSITEKNRDTDVVHEVKLPFNVTQIAMEIFENLPEASISLACVGWKYARKELDGEMNPERFKFIFHDYNDDEVDYKEYSITIKEAEKGVAMFLDQTLAGKIHFYGCQNMEQIMDLGNWDAEVVDACVQYAIFGELIYG